jgi:hypothetical protein
MQICGVTMSREGRLATLATIRGHLSSAKMDAYDALTANDHRAISHAHVWTLCPRITA